MQKPQTYFASLLSFAASILASTFALAQDAKIDINVNKGDGGGWYANPIVWIVGGALFILLLVALLRGGGRRD